MATQHRLRVKASQELQGYDLHLATEVSMHGTRENAHRQHEARRQSQSASYINCLYSLRYDEHGDAEVEHVHRNQLVVRSPIKGR